MNCFSWAVSVLLTKTSLLKDADVALPHTNRPVAPPTICAAVPVPLLFSRHRAVPALFVTDSALMLLPLAVMPTAPLDERPVDRLRFPGIVTVPVLPSTPSRICQDCLLAFGVVKTANREPALKLSSISTVTAGRVVSGNTQVPLVVSWKAL